MNTIEKRLNRPICLGAMEITFPSNISLLSLLQNPPVYTSFNGSVKALPTQDALYLGLADQQTTDCLNLGKQEICFSLDSKSKSIRTSIIYFNAPIDYYSYMGTNLAIHRLEHMLRPLYEKYDISFKFAFYLFHSEKTIFSPYPSKLNYTLSSVESWSPLREDDFYLPAKNVLLHTAYIWENGCYKNKIIFRIKPLDGPFVFIDSNTFKETNDISDSKCGFCNNAPICKLADNRNFCENFIVKHDSQSLYFNRYITDDYHKRAIKEWILESEKQGIPSF